MKIWFQSLDKKIYVNDRFRACLDISFDPRKILIATNLHILLVKEDVLFGNWKIDWTYELGQLVRNPEIINHELKFTIKVKRVSFYSKKKF